MRKLAKIKAKQATAAIVLHYGGNDWSTAQVDGLKSELGKLGIQVIAVSDANFKPDQQVSDIETVLAKQPDLIISIPTDPVATAGAYRRAVDQDVLAAARANGRNDLIVTTIDLGQNVAIDMARGGPTKGLGARRPFHQDVPAKVVEAGR